MLSTNIEILKSSLSKYEVAELHIEHYTSISFHVIFILTCPLLIIYIYILIIYGTFQQLLQIFYVAESTTNLEHIKKEKKRKERKKPFLQLILLVSCPYSTSSTRYNENKHK
jgi:hypothetical protein